MKASPESIWCLHGNLQQPAVWDPFDTSFYRVERDGSKHYLTLTKHSLWDTRYRDFSSWTESFCTLVEKVERAPVLMGYSLGGRLALHALLACSMAWSGAVIIAADPGFSSEELRRKQRARDKRWAQRFLTEPWDMLMHEWNRLPVFGGRFPKDSRKESDFSREAIAHGFDVFSKGRQADLLPGLRMLTHPGILYVSGEEDIKYRSLGDKIAARCPMVSHAVIPGAGHRSPWENPSAFRRAVQTFLIKIS